MLDIWLCRLRGIRIIWTLHNLVEHESKARDQELRARAALARSSNAVIAHSEEALEAASVLYGVNLKGNGHVIPHGNYIGIYEYDEVACRLLKEKYDILNSNIVVLYFGFIRQYKGLATFLPIFRHAKNQDLRLIIAGRPLDEATERWLEDEGGKDARIRLCLSFVPENQVAAFFNLADVVAIPLQNSLTSGSAILAMGFERCLLLPDNARVLGVPGESGALYYKDDLELERLLDSLPSLDLASKGAHNLKVARGLDWKRIATATAKVYSTPRERLVWAPLDEFPQSPLRGNPPA